jgi:hypothetical protein
MSSRPVGHSMPVARSKFSLPWRRKSKTLSGLIWAHFIAQPGFREETRQAILDLKAGRITPLREIPRDRQG